MHGAHKKKTINAMQSEMYIVHYTIICQSKLAIVYLPWFNKYFPFWNHEIEIERYFVSVCFVRECAE